MSDSERPHSNPFRPRDAEGPASACPSDADLSRFIDGAADPAAHAVVLAHLEQCDDCREVVATVVQAQSHLAAASPVTPMPTEHARADMDADTDARPLLWRRPWAMAVGGGACFWLARGCTRLMR